MEKAMISVVVPTKNSAPTLEACLKSIRGQDYPKFEIIVVDAESKDATQPIARKYADRLISADAAVSRSRNIGFGLARGSIFLSVDADMALEPGLLSDIASAMGGNGALVIPELGTGSGFLSRAKSLEKRCYLGDASMESARAFTKKAFASVSGYDERLKFGEDWDLHCRIASSSAIGRTRKGIMHDTGGLTLIGDLRKFYSYGRTARAFVSKSNPGTGRIVSPSRLLFLGSWRILASSPLEAAGLIALKALEGAAFGLGYLRSLFG